MTQEQADCAANSILVSEGRGRAILQREIIPWRAVDQGRQPLSADARGMPTC